ncbi:hypothetical protein GQ607_010828 [Colletotrichum asianum]|uniref:Azaphilone pigments biosynthesis cluster protein L N-terminal domain-containing protein n=1 Tax=Colletotrichum asianum TaxID=702518 RepID=A0A8H3ZSD7_9PEZI|nr:hypothetical protein GQ607_010828 [Colletotrichum asianum]
MSGVEAGATIVGFGLTSLKTFYQFISNVKDGPERVRDLANDLKSLQAAYERIQALGDLPGIFASSLSLTDLLKDCNEHIERLQDKVGKLQVQPSDKFRGVVWKRLKMALNDVEIAQDLSILSSYVNKFMLEISVIELRLVHQNAGHMSQLVAGGERQITMARQQHSILDQVGKDVGEFFPQIKQVQNGVDAVAVKITNLQSLSVRQSIGIAERLEKLETVVARMSLRNKAPGNEFGIHDNIWPVPQEETENSAILASIQSLCGLVDRQERLVESDEAQDILEDLETLLEDIESSKTSKDRPLLDHGVQIDARDDIGRTSLHYLVYQIRRAGWTSEDDRKSLICLIQNGADIHSRDDAGLSIWDAAKKNNKQGSYARDMWDFVLAYCGFHSEVEAFARETPRHAVYRQGWYSRADFEEIWKGMEHLCPYYGDEASGLDCASFISETPSSSRRPYISDSWASTSSSIDGSDIDQMTPDQQQDLSEDESVKTWLSKPSVSSDMSDSPSAASLQYLGNAEVGFSEEVYENPWAEG